jgi:hypothetical protein
MMITPALHITSGQQEAPPPASNHQGLLETSAPNPSILPKTITPIKRLKHIYQTSISPKPSKSTKFTSQIYNYL